MSIKSKLSGLALFLPLIAMTATPAEAHRRWLLPSSTVLSGESELVTVDAAASNELFIFEHRALGLDQLTVTGPDGKPAKTDIIGSGKYRSSFDLPLTQQGTYRIALVSNGLGGSYKLGEERKRWRGNPSDLATAIPAEATDVNISQVASRTETFATLGEPTLTALAPTNVGLELIPITHPNDLVAGEPAQFKFLLDGKPAAGLEIEWVQGGSRYRDTSGTSKLTTDANGMVEVIAPEAGMYYLEASSSSDNVTDPKIQSNRASYTAVLEFLPL